MSAVDKWISATADVRAIRFVCAAVFSGTAEGSIILSRWHHSTNTLFLEPA